MTQTRQIVVPGELVGTTDDYLPGQNTYQEGRDIRALRMGVKAVRGDRVNIVSLSGRYEPYRGDMVIGTIAELGPSNWYVNVGASNDVGMHVNDVPWRVEFGETSKYLDIGDTVLLKIVHVDELKKAQVSMKDRQCRKLTGGLIYEVAPSKVPRIVGRNGSMITLLKDYTSVRTFVGQNGVIWLDGEPEDVALALEALRKIELEAHTTGLTDRMRAWLEERRPGAADRKRAEREAAETEAAEEDEFRPRAERRPRPKVVRDEEDEEAEDEDEDEEEKPTRREPAGEGRPPRRERGGGEGRPPRRPEGEARERPLPRARRDTEDDDDDDRPRRRETRSEGGGEVERKRRRGGRGGRGRGRSGRKED